MAGLVAGLVLGGRSIGCMSSPNKGDIQWKEDKLALHLECGKMFPPVGPLDRLPAILVLQRVACMIK